MSDISIPWRKMTRRLPKILRYADDRAPTIEEIQQLCGYPDLRIKGIVYNGIFRDKAWCLGLFTVERYSTDRTSRQSSSSKNYCLCW